MDIWTVLLFAAFQVIILAIVLLILGLGDRAHSGYQGSGPGPEGLAPPCGGSSAGRRRD